MFHSQLNALFIIKRKKNTYQHERRLSNELLNNSCTQEQYSHT